MDHDPIQVIKNAFWIILNESQENCNRYRHFIIVLKKRWSNTVSSWSNWRCRVSQKRLSVPKKRLIRNGPTLESKTLFGDGDPFFCSQNHADFGVQPTLEKYKLNHFPTGWRVLFCTYFTIFRFRFDMSILAAHAVMAIFSSFPTILFSSPSSLFCWDRPERERSS